jgi:hypothetical protein
VLTQGFRIVVWTFQEYIMSTNTYAQDLISSKEKEIEELEKQHLGWFARLKRRWANRNVVIAWNVSSWFTVLQVLAGKKIWLWFSAKFPAIPTFFSKLWAGITATVVGVLEFASPV